MAYTKLLKIPQIGIVTADAEKMAKNYEEMLGIGPFKLVVDGSKGIGAQATNCKVHGKYQDYMVKVLVCELDGLEIELVQPLDDISIYAEHLKKCGEGTIQHVAVRVSDNAGFRKLMKEQNVESTLKGDIDPEEGMSFEYFDTGALFGTAIELHDPEPVPDEE